MPYITEDRRHALYPDVIPGEIPLSPGELNFMITVLCQDYLTLSSRIGYSELNEVIGVLECVKQELYRRVIAPYEETKIQDNGDVFFIQDKIGVQRRPMD